jgi:hypothetical protein
MTTSTPATSGRIFISYRREDTDFPAGWLYERLAGHFGGDQILKDVYSVQLGDDVVEVITTAVGSCDVLLAMIGDRWLTITDTNGRRRLDDPDDFVRLEIEAALARRIRVIPILVDGARMPRAEELPDSLARLARRQALELSPARLDADTKRLIRVLNRTIAEMRAPPSPSEPSPGPRPPGPPRPSPSRPSPSPGPSRPWPGPSPSDPSPSPSRPPPSPGPSRPWPGPSPSPGPSPGPSPSPSRPPPSPGAPEQQRRREPDHEVSFTAGYPGLVTPLIWYSLSVYVHLGRLQGEVDQHITSDARHFGLQPAVSKTPASTPLPKGTQLQVSPEVQGVVFNPPAQEVRWLEDLQHVLFRMQATPDAAGRAVLGAVEVRAGPLLVGQVPLSIRVRGANEPQEGSEAPAASTARLFSSIFASYAHKDDHVVRAFAEAYRALGIDVLVDKASLRAGDRWQAVLSRLIEEADLFQLFWSKAASRSRYVAEEWQHALQLQDRKGERFIRPLYWNRPLPRPPAELKHLHFAPLDLTALSSVAGRTRSRPRSLRRR